MRSIYLLIIVVITSLLVSCNKALELSPENSLTYKNGLVAREDFEAALRGAGQLLLYEVRDQHIVQPMKGEYADDEEPGILPERFLSQNNVKDGSWTLHYQLIAQADMILKFIDDAEFDQQWKDIYKGQAYFYKSIAYFELIRQFGDCILVDEEISVEPKAKTPWPLVAEHAIGLSEIAVQLLPEAGILSQLNEIRGINRTIPSRGAANALLAHLCAWKAGCAYLTDEPSDSDELWAKAEAATSEIISSADYRLASNPDDVASAVLTGNSVETVFESPFRNSWNETDPVSHSYPFIPGNYYQQWPVRPGSSPFDRAILPITNESIKTMFTDMDMRKTAWFYDFEEMSKAEHDSITGGFAYPHKYREVEIGTGGWFNGQMLNFNVNKIWWRLADIILLRAECRVHTGNIAGAVGDLNTVRLRAGARQYSPDEYNGDLRYTIFKEREKELLMEGHRYYDVIRNGYVNKELKGGFQIATLQDLRDGALFLAISRYAVPNEFSNNPYLEQNRYWSKFY